LYEGSVTVTGRTSVVLTGVAASVDSVVAFVVVSFSVTMVVVYPVDPVAAVVTTVLPLTIDVVCSVDNTVPSVVPGSVVNTVVPRVDSSPGLVPVMSVVIFALDVVTDVASVPSGIVTTVDSLWVVVFATVVDMGSGKVFSVVTASVVVFA
jgi:hypothetical protein